jgi:integrase
LVTAHYLAWYEREFPDSHYRVRQITEQHLLPAFENKRLGEIAPRDVERWKQDHGKLVKSASVVKELRTLKAILNKAVEWEVIGRNPIGAVDGPRILDSKPKRLYTLEELAELAAAPHWAMWRLYVNTGMRRQKGMMLRPAWVKPDAIPSDVVVVVHDYPRLTRRLGSRGVHFWLQPGDFTIEVCDCGWAPDLGRHFRVAKLAQ